MARLARGEYLNPQVTQIIHTVSRCVRGAYLCGKDSETGRSFEHRRRWIENRLQLLAATMGIECLTYAIMGNHIHLILRSRPDIVRRWSDEEIARRWLCLCPPQYNQVSHEASHKLLLEDANRLAEIRQRMSDISWWMRLLTQTIARRANREDDCKGRFWEGRFHASLLLDESSILACAMYVVLNPIRAAMANSLEDSQFTGIKARIDDLKLQGEKGYRQDPANSLGRMEATGGGHRSGWLSPIQIQPDPNSMETSTGRAARRASSKGFLSISLVRYLALADWTGRQFREDKSGKIPIDMEPILERLGIVSDQWLHLVRRFGRLFKRAAGRSPSLNVEARRRGVGWIQAPGVGCFR